ncbi:site-specific integrase [Salmonella enterica]|nr:site-specific integrase [Salmonella enterica]
MTSPLTDSKIRALKAKDQKYEVWHDTGTRGTGRLGIRVYPSGRKSFIFKTQKSGKRSFTTIGDYPQISLSRATEIAKSYNKETGLASSYATIKELFDDYIDNQKVTGRRGYAQKENRLKQVLSSPFIDTKTPAKDVTQYMIRGVLSEFIQRGAVAGSNKVRTDLHAAFNFGLFADNDPTNINKQSKYGLTVNPVSSIPKQAGAETVGERFLSWDELGELINTLNVPDSMCSINPNFARLILLCIYTGGQRPWELMTNLRKNVDEKGKSLTIPPEISKTGNVHVVPLSDKALEIINIQKNLYGKTGFLFPAKTKEGHLLSAELSKQVRKFCDKNMFPPFTPRDIRRTFKTLAGDMGIPLELRDILQNHRRPGVSSKVYDRYYYLREKREIIEQWTNRLKQLTE